MTSLTTLTIAEARAKLKARDISAAELTEDYIKAVEAARGLNAYIVETPEQARASAKASDLRFKAGTAGELEGIPLGIKDLFATRGVHTQACSHILDKFQPTYESTVTANLFREGAVMLGKLNMDEFAMGSSNETSYYGPVTNPWRRKNSNAALVPGGSSGGSASAVAAHICAAATATDTGGSIRQPASFCGVTGFKPTYGRVSRYGLIAFASSFDQIGPFAHDTRDIDSVYRVIAGPDERDNTSSHKPLPSISAETGKLKIGYYEHCLEHPGMDPEIKAHVSGQIERLRADGHVVEPVELPMADLFVPTYYILSTAEASSNLARFDGIRYGHRSGSAKGVDETYRKSRTEGFGPEVKRRILLGTFVLSAGFYDAYYAQGMRVRRMIRDNTLDTLSRFDLVLTPTCPTTAFPHGHISDPVAMYLQDIFTVQANLAGTPAISLPTGTHSNGLPFGIQLMAKPFDDERLLNWSQQLFGG